MGWFKKKTPQERANILKCEIASMEKKVEVLWKLEFQGGYMFGNRDEIANLESNIAYNKKHLEIIGQ